MAQNFGPPITMGNGLGKPMGFRLGGVNIFGGVDFWSRFRCFGSGFTSMDHVIWVLPDICMHMPRKICGPPSNRILVVALTPTKVFLATAVPSPSMPVRSASRPVERNPRHVADGLSKCLGLLKKRPICSAVRARRGGTAYGPKTAMR